MRSPDPAPTPEQWRRALARWPTGVAVVTATAGGRPIGKTVNSFHATSRQPPLVGWCVDHASSRLEQWLAVDGFVVHVVAHDQQHLITRFASRVEDRFAGLAWRPGLDGMPVLVEQVPLRLECRVRHRLAAGDHTYLVGEIVSLAASVATPLVLQG